MYKKLREASPIIHQGFWKPTDVMLSLVPRTELLPVPPNVAIIPELAFLILKLLVSGI
jgi:hypothetical protein